MQTIMHSAISSTAMSSISLFPRLPSGRRGILFQPATGHEKPSDAEIWRLLIARCIRALKLPSIFEPSLLMPQAEASRTFRVSH